MNKLGFAIGVNVAAACLLIQGCKAPRVTDNAYGNEVKTVEPAPAPAEEIKVSEAPAPQPVVVPVPAEPAPVVVEPAPAPAPAPAAYTLYTVKPGDVLSRISKRFNIRQKAILDLNPGLAPNKLYAGKTIKLPGQVDVTAPVAAPAAKPAAPAAPRYTGETKTYVAQRGDSLSVIAHRHGTSVRTLKEINGFSTDRVFIGQKIKVPATAVAAKKPVKKADKPAVKKSDVKAAKAPEAKAAEAKAPEAKAAEKPAAESAAVAPAAAPASAAEATVSTPAPAPAADAAVSTAAPAPAAASEIHTVKEGEDLVSIAISYGLGPSALIEANDLKSTEVKPGDKLKIPAKNEQ